LIFVNAKKFECEQSFIVYLSVLAWSSNKESLSLYNLDIAVWFICVSPKEKPQRLNASRPHTRTQQRKRRQVLNRVGVVNIKHSKITQKKGN